MPDFRYYQTRNEQAMVHTAAAFAKTRNRLQTFVCTSSIGPGATNMVTGAATATINRLPVLLLPGDIFARRNVAPVLQQLEFEGSQDFSVNDCFKPVSRYWDRINRPDQLLTALPGRYARPDQPGRDRRGHAGVAAGCPDRGVRLSRRALRRSASGTSGGPGRTERRWSGPQPGSRPANDR